MMNLEAVCTESLLDKRGFPLKLLWPGGIIGNNYYSFMPFYGHRVGFRVMQVKGRSIAQYRGFPEGAKGVP